MQFMADARFITHFFYSFTSIKVDFGKACNLVVPVSGQVCAICLEQL